MELKIIMDNCEEYIWAVTHDLEYDFIGRFFVVKKDNQWVGMYATDRVLVVEVR